MQRKRIVEKIKPPIQEGRKRGEKMKAQLALMDLVNYGICADDKKIAQRAREVCKALGGLSYNEAMATLHDLVINFFILHHIFFGRSKFKILRVHKVKSKFMDNLLNWIQCNHLRSVRTL